MNIKSTGKKAYISAILIIGLSAARILIAIYAPENRQLSMVIDSLIATFIGGGIIGVRAKQDAIEPRSEYRRDGDTRHQK